MNLHYHVISRERTEGWRRFRRLPGAFATAEAALASRAARQVEANLRSPNDAFGYCSCQGDCR